MDVIDIAAELKYWETRATTAEEKVKEWSVRTCEAEERISKAKAILEGFRVSTFGNVAAPVIDDVLTALEGK